MKLTALKKHLRSHDCEEVRDKGKHTFWKNSETGALTSVPRHNEIPPGTVRNICQKLGIPIPPGK